jgi:antitoxin component of MazEF toxin-antitoxin module
MECGAEEKRLQWTHFKFKCTGKFKNGKEYMAAYPGAKVVDADLAAKTAITLENLILKYGTIEGTTRWAEYKKKQAYSNSFEYKKERYGWSKEDFDKFNSSRSVTIDNMIARHGESEGIKKWEDYCERQAYTNTKQYFIEKYGNAQGLQKYIDINKRKAVNNPKNLAEKLNISIDDAVNIIVGRKGNIFSSILELEFVTELENTVGTLEYTNKTKPYGKWSTFLNTYVVFDIKHKNCIIEFNGDYWHANPQLFTSSAIIRGKKAEDIWKRDQMKLKTATVLGFKTYVVWESEFKNNRIETINKVAEWILNEQH